MVQFLKNRGTSRAQSENVLSYVEPYVEIVVGEGNVTEHIVRKLAHVLEYGTLGCELALLCVIHRGRRQFLMNAASAGLAAAVVDEALQIVSDRGPLVQDVLLDFAAFMAFMALLLGILTLSKRLFWRLSAASYFRRRNSYYRAR